MDRARASRRPFERLLALLHGRGRPLAAVLTFAATAAAAVTRCTPSPTGVPGGEVRVESAEQLSDRLIELTVDADGVGTTKLRLLLPHGFDEEPDRSWPVLYLLHGGGGSYRDWTDSSDVEELTAPLDVIVAMPDSGPGATYVDWAFARPDGSRPQYETYITQLLPAFLRTAYRADDRAAVAGLSAGGFGAMSYAARHPDRYRAVASFSGNLDTRDGDEFGPWLSAIPTFALESTFPLGDPVTQEVRWRGHNPLDLVPNLAGVDVYVSGGNGNLGPLSMPTETPDFLTLESSTERRSRSFAARAEALAIPVTTHFYGDGTHTFRYWNRELSAALPMLMTALERGRPSPEAFQHRSTDDRFSVWGWTFEVTNRNGPAFTDVAVDVDRISATGNGTLHVTSPGGDRATIHMGRTAETYGRGADQPGPRPIGPPAVATVQSDRHQR